MRKVAMHCWSVPIRTLVVALGLASLTLPGARAASGSPAGFVSVGAAVDGARTAVVDTTPRSAELRPSGSSAMEVAWGSNGSPDVLQVVVAGVDAKVVTGLAVRLEFMGKWGRDEVPLRSLQGLSSLDAEDFGRVGEAWVEWTGVEGVRVKAGRVDGNTEFAVVEVAGLFANPSFGLSPALDLLPSYPTPTPSLNVFVHPGLGGAELGSGVYRVGDGRWSVVNQLEGSVPGLPVRWTAGVTAPFGGRGVGGEADLAGYVIVEASRAGSGAVFGKVAGTGELLHMAGGFTVPVPGAGATRAGLGGSWVSTGGRAGEDELVAEAFVAIRPVPWLVVQPDVQLRVAPGASPRAGALLRVVVER